MEENKNVNNQEEKIFVDNKEEDTNAPKQGIFNPNQFYFPTPITSKDDTLKEINAARSIFYQQVESANKTKKILLFSFVGLFLIFAMLLLIDPEIINKLFTPLVVVFIVFLAIVYLINNSTKRKKNVFMDEYRYHYFLNIDSYCYYLKGFSNIELSYNTKIDLEEVNKISCYENITSCPTRDVVKGKIFGVDFISFDALIKTKIEMEGKQLDKIVFSGKVFKLDLKVKKAGKMFIYLKGCGDSYPTDLRNTNEVDIKDLKREYKVYSSFENPSSILTKSAVESLNKFEINEYIEDIIISITAEGIYFGLSLTTKYMTIPYQEDVDESYLNNYKKALEQISVFVASLASSKSYNK